VICRKVLKNIRIADTVIEHCDICDIWYPDVWGVNVCFPHVVGKMVCQGEGTENCVDIADREVEETFV